MEDSMILDCIKTMQDVRLYVKDLENKVSELKDNQTTKSLLSYIQFYIYCPKKVFKHKQKCNKCDSNGMIRVNDSFYNRFKICDCQSVDFEYVVRKLGVVSTSYIESEDSKTYDCVDDDGNLISVNIKYVKKNFDLDDIKKDIVGLFYTDEKDCCSFCDKMNANKSGD